MNLRNTSLALLAAASFAVVGCGSEDAEPEVVATPVEEPAPAPEPVYEAPEPAPERSAEPAQEEVTYVDPADYLSPDEMRYREFDGGVDWDGLSAAEMDGFDDAENF